VHPALRLATSTSEIQVTITIALPALFHSLVTGTRVLQKNNSASLSLRSLQLKAHCNQLATVTRRVCLIKPCDHTPFFGHYCYISQAV